MTASWISHSALINSWIKCLTYETQTNTKGAFVTGSWIYSVMDTSSITVILPLFINSLYCHVYNTRYWGALSRGIVPLTCLKLMAWWVSQVFPHTLSYLQCLTTKLRDCQNFSTREQAVTAIISRLKEVDGEAAMFKAQDKVCKKYAAERQNRVRGQVMSLMWCCQCSKRVLGQFS